MAPLTGLKPAASTFAGLRSIQLSYKGINLESGDILGGDVLRLLVEPLDEHVGGSSHLLGTDIISYVFKVRVHDIYLGFLEPKVNSFFNCFVFYGLFSHLSSAPPKKCGGGGKNSHHRHTERREHMTEDISTFRIYSRAS